MSRPISVNAFVRWEENAEKFRSQVIEGLLTGLSFLEVSCIGLNSKHRTAPSIRIRNVNTNDYARMVKRS